MPASVSFMPALLNWLLVSFPPILVLVSFMPASVSFMLVFPNWLLCSLPTNPCTPSKLLCSLSASSKPGIALPKPSLKSSLPSLGNGKSLSSNNPKSSRLSA